MVAEVSHMKLPSDECHKTLLMISQQWLGAIGQQAITWANVDPDLCRQMASLGLNKLNLAKGKNCNEIFFIKIQNIAFMKIHLEMSSAK